MLEAFVKDAQAIDINLIASKVLSRHTQTLIELQKKRLSEGKRTEGPNLEIPYSKSWAIKRQKAGLTTSIKTLDFSGDHYSGMYADVSKDYTEMGSRDWKEGILEWAWGNEIYGLSDDDIDYLLWNLGLANELAEEYRLALIQ